MELEELMPAGSSEGWECICKNGQHSIQEVTHWVFMGKIL